jgi:hypothetical protein
MAYGGSSIDVTPSMARSSMPAFGHSMALICGIFRLLAESYPDSGVSGNILFSKTWDFRPNIPVRFARRNRFALMVVAVLLIANVLVLRQYQLNASTHRNLREDLILLYETGHSKEAGRIYEKLVQRLPQLTNQALIDELGRTRTLVDEKASQQDNLIWKYHWAVKRNLEKRAEQRLAGAIKRAERD